MGPLSTVRLVASGSNTFSAPVGGNGTLQFASGDYTVSTTASTTVTTMVVAESASLTFPATATGVSVLSSFVNRGTAYFGVRGSVANFTRTFSYTQTSAGNTVVDFEYSLADGSGRYDVLTFSSK